MICNGSPQGLDVAFVRCVGEEVQLDGAARLGVAHGEAAGLAEVGIFRSSLHHGQIAADDREFRLQPIALTPTKGTIKES